MFIDNMYSSRVSKQPSQYPRAAFHVIRISQLVSAIIVSSIISFFIHHLELEHYQVPWTFIMLITVSVFTVASYLVTSFFYHTRTVSPKMSALINGFLTVLWILGLGMIMINVSGTLTHKCNIANWTNDAGIMVCRIYKSLTAFTLTGLVSTMLCLALDIRVYRQATARGKYNNMQDIKTTSRFGGMRSLSNSNGFNDNYQDADLEVPEFSHEVKKPYKVQQTIEVQSFGYAAPTEQTTYDGPGGAHVYNGHKENDYGY